MLTAIIAAALSALTPQTVQPSPARPEARPALWVVNDPDTVIYLFGTFHALDGQGEWFNHEVRTALYSSDQLMLETLVPAAPGAENSPSPMVGSFDRQPPAFAPIGPVAGSASFLSTSKMVMRAGRSRGMATDRGADTVLRRAAEQLGKPIGGLESFEAQLGMFKRLPGAPAPADPAQAAAMTNAMSALLAQLQEAWKRGDCESFAPMLEQMRAQSPDSYRMLFADRNTRWAEWIARRLEQPGVVFVAVGAGHLAGRDSVQNKLALAGVRSARIN